jgi:thiol-disulfide isomerase/thioredoxin
MMPFFHAPDSSQPPRSGLGRPWRSRIVAALALLTAGAASAALMFDAYQRRSNDAATRPAPAAGTAPERIGQFALHDRPRPLPALRFVDGNGREMQLSDFRGKVVLLNVWATWCVPCRKEMPQLEQLQARLGGPDFEIVPLSIDRGGLFVVKAFFDELDLQHLRIYLDQSGAASRELGVIGLPTTLLVDREGRELGRLIGPTEWDGPEIDRLIRNSIAGQARSATEPDLRRDKFARTDDPPRSAFVPPT